jgi:hypothetical protein
MSLAVNDCSGVDTGAGHGLALSSHRHLTRLFALRGAAQQSKDAGFLARQPRTGMTEQVRTVRRRSLVAAVLGFTARPQLKKIVRLPAGISRDLRLSASIREEAQSGTETRARECCSASGIIDRRPLMPQFCARGSAQ